jgi:predicted PurR-regulated permease PerM
MKATTRRLSLAASIAVGILAAQVAAGIVSQLHHLLVLVACALFCSIVMEPAVSGLERRGVRRGVAAGVVMGMSVAFAGALIVAGGAVAVTQGGNLLNQLPEILAATEAQLSSWGFDVRLAGLAADGGPLAGLEERLGDALMRSSGRIAGSVASALTLAFVVFYLSADGPRLLRSACSLLKPERQAYVYQAWTIAVEKAGGYIYSRLVLLVISSIVHSAAFAAAGVPYPVPLGLWVGMMSQLIPVLGAYLGGALPVVIALSSSPRLAVAAVAIVVVYQQVENFVLAPRVTRSAVNVHPLTAFLSVLVGVATIGWVGALLAIPVAATASSIAATFITRHDVVHDHPSVARPRRSWRQTSDGITNDRSNGADTPPASVDEIGIPPGCGSSDRTGARSGDA